MFDDDEHEVKVKLHGNSKRLSKEYYRISHTIIEGLKELTKSDPPSIEVNGTMKENIMSKMKELGIRGKPSEVILSDIFGREIGCRRVLGLLDTPSS